MVEVRRLRAVGMLLSLAAVVACSQVWGEPGRDKAKSLDNDRSSKSGSPSQGEDRRFAEELGQSRFLNQPVILYPSVRDGKTYLGLQLQPKLDDVPVRPRDYAVLVSTSASMTQGALGQAINLVTSLSAKLNPNDRISVWTVNTRPHNLTRGFESSKAIEKVVKALEAEFPAGAVNLKQSLTEVIKGFEDQSGDGRQKVIVFLGDGKSLAGPVDGDDRATLANRMVKNQINFYSVPLGARLDPVTLHGFVNATGGRVVRHSDTTKPEATIAELTQAVAAPVLYPTKLQVSADVEDLLPGKLPPLRRDVATLVVGKIKPGPQLSYELTGTVAGKVVTVKSTLTLPEPETDNFFLVHVLNQWKDQKDRPAMIQADRALAYAYEQNQMARSDLLSKADWALEERKLDVALRLYKQVEEIDPDNKRAKAAIDVVEDLRSGKKKIEDLETIVVPNEKDIIIRGGDGKKAQRGTREVLAKADTEEMRQAIRDGVQPPPLPDERNLLKDVKARQEIAGDQASRMVEDAIREANRLVKVRPEEAMQFLERTRDGIQANMDISPRDQMALAGRIERQLQQLKPLAATVKRDQEQTMLAMARRDAAVSRANVEISRQELVRERLRVFHSLMNQGRELRANELAQRMVQDLVAQGQPIPQSVTVAYYQSLAGYHLRETRDIRRQTEERFLATLLRVDKSHIPFPDEPPIEFPSDTLIKELTRDRFSNWAEWSRYRKDRYEVQSFGASMPKRAFELRSMLDEVIDDFQGFTDAKTTFKDAMDYLANDLLKDRGKSFTWEINSKAFEYDAGGAGGKASDIEGTLIAENKPFPAMKKVTLSTILRRLLAKIPSTTGATYMIRRDVIEITTEKFFSLEKSIRVYPVADLVLQIPGPGQFAQQNFINNTGIIGIAGGGLAGIGGIAGIGGLAGLGGGGLAGIGGLAGLGGGGLAGIGGLGGLGGIGGLGGLGGGGLAGIGGIGGLGGLGGGGLAGIGGLGGLGGGGLAGIGGLGGLGGGGLAGIGGIGGLGGAGLAGIGGGGLAGIGGGGLAGIGGGGLAGIGQGAQGGFQGGGVGLQQNSQDRVLITLIKQVVGGPKTWRQTYNPFTGDPITNPNDPNANVTDPLDGGDDNQLGFYSVSMALVVKASSRVTSRVSSPISPSPIGGVAGMNVGGFSDRAKRAMVVGSIGDPNGPIAEALDKERMADPKTMWDEALSKGETEPGLIIAVADFLAQNDKFDHAAELLKAALKRGVVVQAWVYQALAVALRECGGSPEEIERAETSAAELEPLDSLGFIKAAKSLMANKSYDRALAFLHEAARLAPDTSAPYVEALLCAELGRDRRAMEWAAGNLLKRDWSANSKVLHAKANQKVDALAAWLDEAGRKDEAISMRENVAVARQRDLVIKMSFQGEGSLHLRVKEPSGSECTSYNRQTIGGGTLIGELLSESRSETYQASQAYSGDYIVRVERVWGKPQGGKAQIRVIRHQGTKDEQEDAPVTINVDGPQPFVKISLNGGRRTEAAYVPPAAVELRTETESSKPLPTSDRVLADLRNLADPEVTGVERGFKLLGGSNGAAYAPAAMPAPSAPSPNDRTTYQTKVASYVANTLDITAQAVLSADRSQMRISLAPVFTNSQIQTPQAMVNNPLIPGGSTQP